MPLLFENMSLFVIICFKNKVHKNIFEIKKKNEKCQALIRVMKTGGIFMRRLWGKPSIKRSCWVIGTEKGREREAKVIREKVQSTVSQMCENYLSKLYLCK